MSILNVWRTPKQALLCVDTMAPVLGSDVKGQVSKFFTLPHLGCAIALRGSGMFLATLFGAVCMRPFDRFDDLLDVLPKDLPQIWEIFVSTLQTAFSVTDMTPYNYNELVLVGYSHRNQKMMARQFIQQDPQKGFVADWIDEQFSAPWDEEFFKGRARPVNVALMEGLARAQVQLLREKVPDLATGGRLIMCEIRQGSLSIVDRGEIGASAPTHSTANPRGLPGPAPL